MIANFKPFNQVIFHTAAVVVDVALGINQYGYFTKGDCLKRKYFQMVLLHRKHNIALI